MANQALVEYIKSSRSQGYENTSIVEVLRKNSWPEKDINEAFDFISMFEQTPVANPAPQNKEVNISLKQNTDNTPAKILINDNSPFSVGLAIILTVSLFVLVNKIIYDIRVSFVTNPNSELILDALVTIPFLVVSFLLYGLANQNRKKYIIVCQPYFVISAFLFLRLLWDTSRYILDTNATFGVYIVLIMAILVLTGFVIFLQKFFKP